MNTKQVVVAFALSAIGALVAACGGAPDASQTEQAASTDQAATTAGFNACGNDSACVAVPRAGCCHNGWNDAVNVGEIAAYDAANACTTPHPICPDYIVDDTRVAACDTVQHQCVMVASKCVDNVFCKQGAHWDSVHCACEPNTVCLDKVACMVNHHWDTTYCACVPNSCVQTVLCIQGDHFDRTLCKCVP